MTIAKSRFQFREQFFFLLVVPLVLAIEWSVASSVDWRAYPRIEWAALADMCLVLPLIYFAFFSSKLEIKARLIRTAGISGLGMFAVQFIVPEANQFVTPYLAQLRNTLIVFVIIFEGWVLYKLAQAVFKRDADARTLERDFAMPEWIAKLMLVEARFWKTVWSFFKRK